MKSVCLWVIVCVYCLGGAGAWAAEQTAVLDKRVTIYGGVRIYGADGTFSSTKEGNPEIGVDMEDLGLDRNESNAIGGLMINLGNRWNLRFDYYGYHDDATSTAGKDFNFGNVTIPVNAVVDSSLNIDLYVLSAAYNIVHTRTARFGVGAGVHGIDFDLEISGKINVGGIEVPVGDGQEDFLAPVPNVWFYGAYAFTDRIVLRYGGGWLSAGYEDYDGSLLLANAALEYWPFQNLGVGAGYNYITADIEYDPGHRKETYNVDLSGLILYVTIGF